MMQCAFLDRWSAQTFSAGAQRMLAALFAAMMLCLPAAGQEISVDFGRSGVFVGDTVQFGDVVPGRKLVKVFTITNSGDLPLEIGNVTVAAPFEVSLQPRTPLAPRRRTAFRITLPAAAPSGDVLAEVAFTTNDNTGGENNFTFNLQTTIPPIAPDVLVRAGRETIPADGSYSFGESFVGRQVTRTFTITNSGNAPLTVRGVEVDGAGFTSVFRRAVTLRPNRRVNFTLTMNPPRAGEAQAEVRILSDDPDGAFTFNAVGMAAASLARIEVFDRGQSFTSGEVVNFGSTLPGTVVRRQLTIKNSGRQNLALGEAVIEGSGFTVRRQPARTLRPGRSTRIELQMSAEESGSPAAEVSFTTSDPALDQFRLNLEGVVAIVEPELTLIGPGGNLTGGTVNVGSALSTDLPLVTNFTVRNDGTATLEISNPVVGGQFELGQGPSRTSILPGQSTSFSVQLNPMPAASGTYNGTVSFTSNDPDETVFSLNLTGTVVPPPSNAFMVIQYVVTTVGPDGIPMPSRRQVDPNSIIPMEPTLQNQPVFIDFFIRNQGTGDLTLGLPITFTPASATMDYTITQPPAATIPVGGAEISFRVNATAVRASPVPIELTVMSNDSRPQFSNFRFRVAASVTATQPQIQVIDPDNNTITSGSDVSFGATPRGQSLLRTYRIINNGNAPLNLTLPITIAPGTNFAVVAQPATASLPANGGETNFTLQFSAANAGSFAETLSFAHNVTAQSPYTAVLRGRSLDWFTAGSGFASNQVLAITEHDNDADGGTPDVVIAAGTFLQSGVAGVNRIARFLPGSPGQWAALAGGGADNGAVNAVTTWNHDDLSASPDRLAMTGSFTTVGGASISRVAVWDGATWSALAGGLNGDGRALAQFDDDGLGSGGAPRLYVGGSFSTAGGLVANRLARWDGTTWAVVGTAPNTGVVDGQVNALVVFDPDGAGITAPGLYIGGTFSAVGGSVANTRGIARWTGSAFQALAGGSIVTGTGINAMTVGDADGAGTENTSLIVAGSFTNIGGVACSNIARWNGSNWVAFPGTTDAPILALCTHDEDGSGGQPASLFAGGEFSVIGSVTASRIAKWNGTAWQPLRTGITMPAMGSAVRALPNPIPINGRTGSADLLFVGGNITEAGGVSAGSIAVWTTVAP